MARDVLSNPGRDRAEDEPEIREQLVGRLGVDVDGSRAGQLEGQLHARAEGHGLGAAKQTAVLRQGDHRGVPLVTRPTTDRGQRGRDPQGRSGAIFEHLLQQPVEIVHAHGRLHRGDDASVAFGRRVAAREHDDRNVLGPSALGQVAQGAFGAPIRTSSPAVSASAR